LTLDFKLLANLDFQALDSASFSYFSAAFFNLSFADMDRGLPSFWNVWT